MDFINLNGKILPADAPVLMVDNRSFRFGDGLFETMKMVKGRLMLQTLHFERLFSGMHSLRMKVPSLLTPENLSKEIHHLCIKNGCDDFARVRLTFFRGNGGLYDDKLAPQYVIECWPLDSSVHTLNENGLVIDIFPDARKSCDPFSNIKSANCLPYSLAAVYAKENRLNDCLVLNTKGNIADSTIANIFLLQGEKWVTPALTEGCVAGVMRRHLIHTLKESGQFVVEREVSPEDMIAADEVFLTNAIKVIRWVRQFRTKTYSNHATVGIYQRLMKTILS